jgi:hypothetical protein
LQQSADDLKARTRQVRRTFRLDEDPTAEIEDFGAFRSVLDTLVYGAVIKVQDDASPTRDHGEQATATA